MASVFSQISNLYPVLRVYLDILFLLIFIGVELLYNLVLVSTVQKGQSAIHIHTFHSLLDFLPFDGYLILESTGMTCPLTTLTHTSGLERHLAHAPNCWQHNQWYLQTLDFLLGCRVAKSCLPLRWLFPFARNPRISVIHVIGLNPLCPT